MRTRYPVTWFLSAVAIALGGCASDDDTADVTEFVEDRPADVVEDVPGEAPDTVADLGGDDAVEADAWEDEGSTGCPPLTTEEVDFILAAAADQPLTIVTNETVEGDSFLHEVSRCVDPLDPTVAHLISRMRRTLARTFGGVGLAAPQVGVHRRLFLAQRSDQPGRPIQPFLNPTIVEYGAETATAPEGCLSVPGESPSVERSLEVVVDYDLEDGSHVAAERIGGARATQAAYAARIVQHEYDHLDGILIVDPR